MMSALEQEIIQKLHTLNEDQQKRVLAFIQDIFDDALLIRWQHISDTSKYAVVSTSL